MSLSDWHRQGGVKRVPSVKRKSTGPKKNHNSPKNYTPEQVEQFIGLIKSGYSISEAVRVSKITVSKAYTLVTMDAELKECHKRNKMRGFKRDETNA